MLGKRHCVPITQDSFGPWLSAALSVPIALLFGLGIPLLVLGIPGDPTAYTISIVSLGLLTSLELRRGWARLAVGFAVSFVTFLFVIQQSTAALNLSPLGLADGSLLWASLPPSLAVFAAGILFSDKTRLKVVKANALAICSLAVGFGISSTGVAGVNSSSIASSILFLAALGVPANAAQMTLLHLLSRMGKARRFSLGMMPTAFFAYNLLSFASFVSSFNVNRLYPFLSSLAFLPALAMIGMGSVRFGPKTSTANVPSATSTPSTTRPRVTVIGDSSIRQGRQQTVRITTASGGKPRSMTEIRATVTKPGGKTEMLKVSKTSEGQYKTTYQPKGPGNYAVHVTATSKDHLMGDESFSFNVQAPPTHHPPPPPPQPSKGHPAPAPPPPPSPPTTLRAVPQSSSNLPKLDNWNPQLWVGRDLHGYKVKEHLASGLTGYVLHAIFEHNNVEVAIKIPILKQGTGTTALDETMSEATRLLELSERSKYVVQLRGILVDRLNVQEILKGDAALYLQSPPAIVMEFMKGGAAKKLLEDPSYESLYYSEKWGGIVMLIGHMIATALETIHKAGFVHLDVKPQNILFNTIPQPTGSEMMDKMQSGVLVPKLADLGSAVKAGAKVNQFTPEYAPGEQVLGDSAASAMDIYALGATLYNMMTKTPFNSKRLIDAMNNATRGQGSNKGGGELRSAWDSFDPDFARIAKFQSAIPIMKSMLAKDPRQRPDAGTVASSLRNLKDMKISS
ncbi:hypothetical protein E6H36_07370 [Candidatus Bathyarchaeota archaeon]|nr:MAG: hypothetical protein AUJ07_06215 [Crenarchaeota archaeon 13_1_40CM_3_53_5]TMI25083.1 MAG: hypothetical protein E6H36_07370 [Candidatus Bathyarchaeota archaeon]